MGCKRIQQRYTTPEVVGLRITSSDASISGDYVKTGAKQNNYPVFYCAARSMYLFVGSAEIDMMYNNYWALNSTVVASLGDTDMDTGEFTQTAYARHPTSEEDSRDMDTWDISDDFKNPNSSFLTTTWTTVSGTVAITVSDIIKGPFPLLDEFHVDWSGRANRLSTALDIPHEGLAFDVQFTHEVSKAATGQALTIDTQLMNDDVTIWKTVDGFPCLQSYYGRDGGMGGVSFPDDSLNSGRKPITVSAWIRVGGQTPYEDGYWVWLGGETDSESLRFGSTGGTYYDATPSLCINGSGQCPGGVISANQWYHVVLAFTGHSAISYLNGVFQGTCNCDKALTKTGTAYIGRKPNGQAGFPGLVAGVRIYNRILSESEIQCLFNEHSNVVG